MGMFLKRSYKLMIKFYVYFRNIEVINNPSGDMVSYTPQIKHKNYENASFFSVQKGAGCCMHPCDVISSVA